MAGIPEVNLSANKCFGADNEYGFQLIDRDQSGWNAFCKALRGTIIKTLVISDIGLGPVGLSTLATVMFDMTALSEIFLDEGNMIKESDIEKLRANFPNVSIKFSPKDDDDDDDDDDDADDDDDYLYSGDDY